MEKLGVPTVQIATKGFDGIASANARMLKVPLLPVVVIPHPLGGIPTEEAQGKADAAFGDIVYGLMHSPKVEEEKVEVEEERIVVRGRNYADAVQNMNRLFIERHWSDGLPLVPPTEEAVEEMLTGTSHPADEVVGIVEPAGRAATVRAVAINAVMAGARSQYMPVILASVEAITEPAFYLRAVATTTGSCNPMLIVSGPIAKELDINYGQNALGIGWPANATIGRAISLIIKNVGGVVTGITDLSTYGGAWEYTCCLAENEDALPSGWVPLRVEKGYDWEVSTVTVKSIMGQMDVFGHTALNAKKILLTIATEIAGCCQTSILWNQKLVVDIVPEHAALLARDGYSKEDVKLSIYENARLPFKMWKELADHAMLLDSFPKWVKDLPDDYMMSTIPKPEDILLIVAGGLGKHSVWWPGCHGNPVTKAIDKWR